MEELQMIWGWQPALYLFLGGVGAGAFLTAGVLYLKDREHNRMTICVSMWAALVCLGVGLLLLLSELTNPLRGLLLWQSFSNNTSWMMFGAWAALAAMVVYLVAAILMTGKVGTVAEQHQSNSPARRSSLCKGFVIVGIILSLCVAVYTGMLLMAAPGVPLWNSWLLPCLFTVSAIDTGIALVEIVSVALSKKETFTHEATVLLERSVVAFVSLESIVLAIYVIVALAGESSGVPTAIIAAASMQMMVLGAPAPAFWLLLVVCGLVFPLAVSLYSLAKKDKRLNSIMVTGAVGALVGGCTLRFLILLVGQHADLVADTLALLAL